MNQSQNTPENIAYIGDSVYAYFDGNGIELRLNHHLADRAIYLESEVLRALVYFYAKRTEKTLALPKVESNPRIASALASERSAIESNIEVLSKVSSVLQRLPDHIIEKCCIVCGALIIYHCNRDNVSEIMSALAAGKWSKELCGAEGVNLNYKTTIDGLAVEIFNTPAPASCQIVETTEEVPAHTKTVRKLVCK